MTLVIGILLVVMAVVLVVAVLMQEGKDKRLSGTITGGADNFFSQGKGGKAGKLLPTITTVVSIVFVILVVVLYIIAPTTTASDEHDHDHGAEVTDSVETDAPEVTDAE